MAELPSGAAAAAFSKAAGLRDDPYVGYRFMVELQGLLAGGFSEVSGLDITTEIESIRQGGNNTFAHRLPGPSSYGDIQLMRGLSDIDMLWPWYQDVIAGRVKRRNGTIYLLGGLGLPTMWWNFRQAYPVAWVGPKFDAGATQVLFTSITLVHEGLDNPVMSKSGSLGGLL